MPSGININTAGRHHAQITLYNTTHSGLGLTGKEEHEREILEATQYLEGSVLPRFASWLDKEWAPKEEKVEIHDEEQDERGKKNKEQLAQISTITQLMHRNGTHRTGQDRTRG